MTYFSLFSSPRSILVLASLLTSTFAHMEMSDPLPMRSRLDPLVPVDEVDYNLKSPLNADGSNYPCRGYQNDRPIRTTATYTAGQSYTMSVTDTVTHGGGSCQLSLSYDNGATFRVIKSIIGGCPLIMSYNFTIPAYAPSGNALFAWTWFNEIGNREMYMNCAQVNIQGSSAARRSAQKRGGQFTSMDDLPFIWRANIDGLSTCATTEGDDPVFPNLGPDVLYQHGMSSSDPITPGNNCDSPTPYGQLYQALNGTATPDANLTSASNSPISAATATGPSASSSTATTTSSSAPTIRMSPFNSTSSATSVPVVSKQVTQTFNGSTSYLAYASAANSSSYLPCVPGSFICASSTSYYMCDEGASTSPSSPTSTLVGPLDVAAGMACAPYLTQFSDASTAAEYASNTAFPSGWYRSDRYVAAGSS